jgi:GT2 family glycosyltransferase
VRVSVILYIADPASRFEETARSILQQASDLADGFELIVVDNNPSEAVRARAESLVGRFPGRLYYLAEPRQGRSFGLNEGIRRANGELIAITDGDVTVRDGWLSAMVRALERDPAEGVGGPVLPVWEAARPSWLGEDLYGKLGLMDWGPEPCCFEVGCVPVGCNVAFRRAVFDRYGFYNTELGWNREVLLSDEDDEFFTRILAAGGRIVYEPDAVALRRVPPARMSRNYLRRLELLSGMSNANRPDRSAVALFGIPRYLYRHLVESLARWLGWMLAGQPNRAFRQELFLWLFMGYAKVRWMKR